MMSGVWPNWMRKMTLRVQACMDSKPLPRLLIIGDSISVHYAPHLDESLRGRFECLKKEGLGPALADLDVPLGANWGDSAMVLERLRKTRLLETAAANVALVNCGLHDIKRRAEGAPCQVPLARYRENLEKIVDLFAGTKTDMVWVHTTPVEDERHARLMKNFMRFNRDCAEYNAAAAEIMERRKVPVIDLCGFTEILGQEIFDDHVHFIDAVRKKQAQYIADGLMVWYSNVISPVMELNIPTAPPDIAVCICTRNRVKYLGAAIESVLAQEVASKTFEVRVVDNGSTDGTAEMVRSRFGSGTRVPVRCVREEKAGLSRARNRAIAETSGEYIAFIDDDAIAEPGWLQAILHGFSLEPGIDSVGGAVVPVYEEEVPSWLAGRIHGIFSPWMPPTGAQLVSYPRYPYGANIAFRRSVFARVGLFREDLGYRGDRLMPAEETELLLRLEKSGGKILSQPKAIVRHLIPASRTARPYLRERFYSMGKGYHELEKTRRHDFESWGYREIVNTMARGWSLYKSARAGIRRYGRLSDHDSFDKELSAWVVKGRATALLREAGEHFWTRTFKWGISRK